MTRQRESRSGPFWSILTGDCRASLATLDAGSVQTCVTSPPYFGLRDYGHDGQIGLEPTPDEFVAALVDVFRSVRRVLRDDGTVWLNLGDSYCSTDKWGGGKNGNTSKHTTHGQDVPSWAVRARRPRTTGDKPKDLLGIPWRVAEALKAPYYTGTIPDERDRIWLAAMIDAEGCMFIHKRKVGQSNGQGYVRKNDSYGAGLEVSSTDRVIVDRIAEITGRGSISEQSPEQNPRRKQTIYRWNLRSNECRDVIREVYPYLVAKQHEARLVLGCPSSGTVAEAAHEALKAIHQGGSRDVDFPAPSSMFEPGWYLRSDIIWSKPSPMPESVTDRPTKAHEYLFLLSKSKSYYYDAIKESAVARKPGEMDGGAQRESDGSKANDGRNFRKQDNYNVDGSASRRMAGFNDRYFAKPAPLTRNKRSVWTVATQPYPGAHFATFPPKLIEPCILAGCPAEGTVLDPFAGAGTTGMVALRHNRSFIGCELNPEYVEMARDRIIADSPLLNTHAEAA